MIYKILHRKLKFEHHEPHKHLKMNSDAPEVIEVPATLRTPVVLFMLYKPGDQ